MTSHMFNLFLLNIHHTTILRIILTMVNYYSILLEEKTEELLKITYIVMYSYCGLIYQNSLIISTYYTQNWYKADKLQKVIYKIFIKHKLLLIKNIFFFCLNYYCKTVRLHIIEVYSVNIIANYRWIGIIYS